MLASDAVITYPGQVFSALYHLSALALIPALIIYAWYRYGRKFVAEAFIILAGGGLLAEVIGITYGIPFGAYSYTNILQPQILGVPVQILLAWFTLGLMCYSIPDMAGRSRIIAVVAAAALMVAWDVQYDPLFAAIGMWVWKSGQYFGVPITNFIGWFLCSLVFFALLALARAKVPGRSVTVIPVVIVYLAYFADGAIQNAYFGRPAAASVGAAVMALSLVIALGTRFFRTQYRLG